MLERHAARRIARGHGALALVGALLVATPGAATAAVRVAGVQVVGPGLGANGTEIQPFHQGPGLTLALLTALRPRAVPCRAR